jgi:hypothetical protein
LGRSPQPPQDFPARLKAHPELRTLLITKEPGYEAAKKQYNLQFKNYAVIDHVPGTAVGQQVKIEKHGFFYIGTVFTKQKQYNQYLMPLRNYFNFLVCLIRLLIAFL